MKQISVYVWKVGSRERDDEDITKLEEFAIEKDCSYCYEWGEVTRVDEKHFDMIKIADGCFEDDEVSIFMFLMDFRIFCEENQIKDFTFNFRDSHIRKKVEEVLLENFPATVYPKH